MGAAIFFALNLAYETGIIIASIGLMFFLLLGYYIFFEINWWVAPGKRLVGIRVVKTDGLPVSASNIIIRNLMRAVDVASLVWGGLDHDVFSAHQIGRYCGWTFVTLNRPKSPNRG